MIETPFLYTAADGTQLAGHRWSPEGEARAVVVVVHGASEHVARYARLAGVLTGAGIEVVGIDQRGHGDAPKPGVARPGGWTAMVGDAVGVVRQVAGEAPDRPVVLLGHSMGAAVVQGALAEVGALLAAAVLSGPAAPVTDPDLLALVAQAAEGDAADEPSALFAAVFAGFNGAFGDVPDATGYEWLSRDPAEVRAYVDDPRCGDDVPLSNGFVADMLVDGMGALDPARLDRIPTGLPLLVVAGSEDPVTGGSEALDALVDGYRSAGMAAVDLRTYPGARHELFNETNRDEVQADLVAWLDRQLT